MFRDMDPGRGTKRKREKDRMDPRKSRRPELPVSGPGKGGRVGASATQHVVQNLVRDTMRDEDVSSCCHNDSPLFFPSLLGLCVVFVLDHGLVILWFLLVNRPGGWSPSSRPRLPPTSDS